MENQSDPMRFKPKQFTHRISLNVVRLNKLALGIGISILCIVLYIITDQPKVNAKHNPEDSLYNAVIIDDDSVPSSLL